MEGFGSCKNCSKRTLVPEADTGNLTCSSCGVVQDYNNYEAQIGGITGPLGTYVRLGTAGTGTVYDRKQTKIYGAQKLIEDLMFQLGFSRSKSDEVKLMVEKITEGEYGQGRWFLVFVGACAYVVRRKESMPLSIVEVAEKVGCDVYELGRMVYKVVDFLDLKLPGFDIVGSFECSLRNCPSFCEVGEDMIGRMLKQGVFLVQCLVKWYVTTGRRPLPVVAAVLVFVAQINQVDVKIEDVANELGVAVVTCKLRYKELLERLVKVGKALPWGQDVTVKNILKNAPFVIQYMELKSMSKSKEKTKNFEFVGFDMSVWVDDLLSEENDYSLDTNDAVNDSRYFRLGHSESPYRFQFSQESLTMIYSKLKNDASVLMSTDSTIGNRRKMRRGFDILSCTDWWKGESELSKKLLLKQILEKDVGLCATPPSFDRGCLAYEKRKEKIKAAKMRIHRTMHPLTADSDSETQLCRVEHITTTKKKRRKIQYDVDWEDIIIESLLLHQVEEKEIETGHYKALLDLYVFNY